MAYTKGYGCSADTISLHLKNIYADGELVKEATAEEISVVAQEGQRSVRQKQTFYNLDAIISVGYRVNPKRATRILKEYMLKGFVMDGEP